MDLKNILMLGLNDLSKSDMSIFGHVSRSAQQLHGPRRNKYGETTKNAKIENETSSESARDSPQYIFTIGAMIAFWVGRQLGKIFSRGIFLRTAGVAVIAMTSIEASFIVDPGRANKYDCCNDLVYWKLFQRVRHSPQIGIAALP